MIRIIHADVLDGLAQLPDQSVHCVVTSPPYWGLRDYGVDGQIGLERTPEEYVARMVGVFREVRRVLRDDGTVWLNIGDGYNANTGAGFNGNKRLDKANRDTVMERPAWLKQKDMVGIPWRLAFALQADGWYLRSDIIWSKPNPMPESVTYRPTKRHEYVFLLTKKARYFYDADAVREDQTRNTHSRGTKIFEKPDTFKMAKEGSGIKNNPSFQSYMHDLPKDAGRNRRTVWEIATQPFPEAHFATFPEALVEPCIKAGTSERGCCSICGAPWVRVVEKGEPLEEQRAACGADKEGGYNGISLKHEKLLHGRGNGHFHQKDKALKQDALGKQTYTGFNARYKQQNASDVKRRILEGMRERISEWRPSCTCSDAEIVPCVVLDPFGGSGTVAKVARDLGRKSILIELSADYIKIARERLRLNEQLVGI